MFIKTDASLSRLVISQPMFLPWCGMFEQIKLSQQFVFYDDVQLPLGGGRGRGFTTRVQIKTARGIEWLTLPVMRAGEGKQLICDARFAHMDWKQAHLSKIEQVYCSSPYFDSVYHSLIVPIYKFETDSLAEFCIESMKLICVHLDLSPKFYRSSDLPISRDMNASERILEICRHLGATDYVSGLGAMNYIDYTIFEEAGIRVNYMDYTLRPYPQLYGVFTPYVSIIDMLFNLGITATSAELQSPCRYWKHWPHMIDDRPVFAPP